MSFPNMDDIQRRLTKDAMAGQVLNEGQLGGVGPQILFPSALVDILRATDPTSGRPVVNLLIRAGNGALSVIVPLPAEVTPELAQAGIMKPATIAVAEALAAPEYRLVRVQDMRASEASIEEPDGAELEITVDPETRAELESDR